MISAAAALFWDGKPPSWAKNSIRLFSVRLNELYDEVVIVTWLNESSLSVLGPILVPKQPPTITQKLTATRAANHLKPYRWRCTCAFNGDENRIQNSSVDAAQSRPSKTEKSQRDCKSRNFRCWQWNSGLWQDETFNMLGASWIYASIAGGIFTNKRSVGLGVQINCKVLPPFFLQIISAACTSNWVWKTVHNYPCRADQKLNVRLVWLDRSIVQSMLNWG